MTHRYFRNAVAIALLPFVVVAIAGWVFGLVVYTADIFRSSSFNALHTELIMFALYVVSPVLGLIGYLRWWLFAKPKTQKRSLLITLACSVAGLPVILIFHLITWNFSMLWNAWLVFSCVCILFAIGEMVFCLVKARTTRGEDS